MEGSLEGEGKENWKDIDGGKGREGKGDGGGRGQNRERVEEGEEI